MKIITDRRQFLAAGAGFGATLAMPTIVGAQTDRHVNLYTARHYGTDDAFYTAFKAATGITVNRVEAGADALIQRITAEGANSPVDVFITVDAGNLERARAANLFQPVNSEAIRARVPAHLRDPDGNWFGFTTRARVIVYHKDRVRPEQLSTYEDLADPKWKGKLLIRSSTNIYNQSLTGSVLAARGEAATLAWARGIAANLARPPRGGDTDQIKAAFAGEGDLAVSNTYYLGNMLRENKADDQPLLQKMAVHFPNQGDRGTHMNLSGAGMARHARNKEAAIAFLEYLASDAAQRHFAETNSEYPVVDTVPAPQRIAAWGNFKQDPLNAAIFARNNAAALQLMDRSGWK
ncbi:MAG: Fe(3+) ABC transporter substrate-binding protein [Bosea sp. (in: a-proteobacteria)]